MERDAYKKLADHLDNLPGGFAPSDTGVELRLLQRLFTPEEAELAVYLTLEREEPHTIANRAKISIEEAEQRLTKHTKHQKHLMETHYVFTSKAFCVFRGGVFFYYVISDGGCVLGGIDLWVWMCFT